ncbi:MAG: AAA family ATPase, partial [Bacteroidetes bacterium]|nr:AAA family ATPase [Bacteroidota bacterium]
MALSELLYKNFPFTPTGEQRALFGKLEKFLERPVAGKSVFVLKGYAGTGKTVVLQTLARSLAGIGRRTTLLAPTGRAAKVLAKSTIMEAHTIHRELYKPIQHPYSGKMDMELRKNYHARSLFVVDEASML